MRLSCVFLCVRLIRALALFPKTFVDGTRLFFQGGYRTGHFDAAFTMGKDFPAGEQQVFGRGSDDGIEIDFAEGVDHPPNLTPIDCPGAHDTWFGA